MARNAALPILTAEPGLTHYLEEIRRFPMLERQEQYMLAKRWREHGDRDAAHKLVTSHLRLVPKIARNYRGYGLAISEGNVGLMKAVGRFEPEKGFRLATYAVWWIKATIRGYILRSRSLVKMGTTANQKKRLRRADLDKEGSRILVRDMKNPGEKIGNDVWCDLPAEALQIILSMPSSTDEIFPFTTDAIGMGFTRACQFLGIDDLHFHDLRHEGVSRLFEIGRKHSASRRGFRASLLVEPKALYPSQADRR